MSSLSLNLYMKADGAAAQEAIRTFVRHVNAQDYAAVEAMDVEETLYDVDDIFAAAITLREREGSSTWNSSRPAPWRSSCWWRSSISWGDRDRDQRLRLKHRGNLLHG